MDDKASEAVDTPEQRSLLSPASQEHDGADQISWADRYAKGKTVDEDTRQLWREFDNGWVMVSELVAATLVWGGIGWLADQWLNLAPVLMSIGFVVGFSAGFYLIWARTSGRIGRPSQQAATHDTDHTT